MTPPAAVIGSRVTRIIVKEGSKKERKKSSAREKEIRPRDDWMQYSNTYTHTHCNTGTQ